MRKITLISLCMILQWPILAKTPRHSWLHIRPRVFLGVGFTRILSENRPVFEVEDDLDATYLNMNPLHSEGFSFRGQLRLNIIQAGPVELGYTFWGHRRNYDQEYPTLWFRNDKAYPLNYDLSAHMAAIQINLPAKFWNGHVKPFVLGGGGIFYGASRNLFYEINYEAYYYYTFKEKSASYEGNSWMTGVGAVIYDYAYIYAGIIGFNQPDLPGSLFLDFVVGVRL